MTLRSTALVLTALLLPAAAVAATVPAASIPVVAPIATAVGEPAACQASRATFGVAQLAPAPTPLGTPMCGECSTSPCQGAAQGALCGESGGQYGYCQSPLGDTCSTHPLQWQCQCWYGPLP